MVGGGVDGVGGGDTEGGALVKWSLPLIKEKDNRNSRKKNSFNILFPLQNFQNLLIFY
jgi:hypothetical protein